MASTQPNLKLVYFGVQAKGEPARILMAYAGLKWEDASVQDYFGVDWPTAKAQAKTPMTKVPILDVDGVALPQSGSIVRYLADLTIGTPNAVVPSSAFARAQCDSIYEFSVELCGIDPIVNVFTGETFGDKKKAFDNDTLQPRLSSISRLLGDKDFFCGDKPLYCDFAMYHVLDNTRLVYSSVFDAYPNVTNFLKRVEALAGVKEYLDSRPVPVNIGEAPTMKQRS